MQRPCLSGQEPGPDQSLSSTSLLARGITAARPHIVLLVDEGRPWSPPIYRRGSTMSAALEACVGYLPYRADRAQSSQAVEVPIMPRPASCTKSSRSVKRRALAWRGGVLALIVVATFLAWPGRPAAAAAAAAVSSGGSHTCAVTTSGGLKCWGRNNADQLGDGTTTVRLTPVDVAGLTSDVAAVSSGVYHTCAVTTSGALKCWGNNFAGQLGDGTITSRLAPVDVVGSRAAWPPYRRGPSTPVP